MRRAIVVPPFPLFTLLGLGILLPWNVLLTSFPHFLLYLPSSAPFWVSNGYTGALFLALLGVSFRRCFGDFEMAVGGYLMMGLPLLICALADPSLALLIPLSILVGAGDGLVQASLFRLASAKPGGALVAAVMLGNGASGLFVTTLKVLCMVAVEGEGAQAKVYFAIGAVMIVGCVAAAEQARRQGEFRPDAGGRGGGEGDDIELMRLNRGDSDPVSPDKGGGMGGTKVIDLDVSDSTDPGPEDQEDTQTYPAVIRQTIQPLLSVFLTFLLTLSCFPGLTTLISSQPFGAGREWYDTVIVLFFNLGDVAGRGSIGFLVRSHLRGKRWPKLLLPEKGEEVKGKLLFPVLLRFGFVVVFPLLVKRPQPPLVVFLLVFSLALTNGYAASLAMVTAPKMVEGGKERVVNVMLLGLFAGLAVGSAVGTGIEALFLKDSIDSTDSQQ